MFGNHSMHYSAQGVEEVVGYILQSWLFLISHYEVVQSHFEVVQSHFEVAGSHSIVVLRNGTSSLLLALPSQKLLVWLL